MYNSIGKFVNSYDGHGYHLQCHLSIIREPP